MQEKNLKDEVSEYQNGRYISSSEAFWRVFGFPIHERYPAIVQLAVHLPNGQRVVFREDNDQAMSPRETTLTAFFKLCQEDEFARTRLYHEVPSYYTWKSNSWHRRKEGSHVNGHPGIKFDGTLGRVYVVHPNQQECFYLRLLLHDVKGPRSFDELRTVDGEICRSYREACDKRGLLEDDSQWDKTLEEAAVSQSARSLRALFAVMLHSCSMSNPLALWEKYKDELSEDFLHQTRLQNPTLQIDFGLEIFNLALIALEDKLAEMGGKQLTHYDLPETHRGQENRLATEVLRETSYNMDELTLYAEENEPKLLTDQRSVYNTILDSVNQQKGRIFFLDAPGGTGKTFVTKLLLSKIRQQGKTALAVASSGIAATLLPGGRTAHSAFKLPLNPTSRDTPVCNISNNSGAGEMLKKCSLIIWDECTMAHRAALEALDRTLQDIRDSTEIMGELTLMLSQ